LNLSSLKLRLTLTIATAKRTLQLQGFESRNKLAEIGALSTADRKTREQLAVCMNAVRARPCYICLFIGITLLFCVAMERLDELRPATNCRDLLTIWSTRGINALEGLDHNRELAAE
jgi:hypothetical protein